MSQNPRHLDFLDPIRGVAILMVFLFHGLGAAYGFDQLPWDGWFRDFSASGSFLALLPATYGNQGVAVFFVVSGFCIHLSFSRKPDWGIFFQRRFFRIYPPYLLSLLFFGLIFPSTRVDPGFYPGQAQLASHALLLHNLHPLSYFGINPSYWSIAVEVQLYAMYPLLIWMIGRLGWCWSLVLLGTVELLLRVGAPLLSSVGIQLPWLLTSGLPLVYWCSWSVGAGVAEWHLRGVVPSLPRWVVPVLALMTLASNQVRPLASLTFPATTLLTAAVMIGRLRVPSVILGSTSWWMGHLRQVGIWSYSIYLLHQPLLWGGALLLRWWIPGLATRPWATFLLCLAGWPLIAVSGYAAYRLVELPSIALGSRFGRRLESRRSRAAVGAPSSG